MDVGVLITLTVALFFILDPFASLPVFISVTKNLDQKEIKAYANKAVLVAAILLFVFVFVGSDLMGIFGVTMDSFRVAGGAVLFMMSIELIFGLKLAKMDDEKGAAWVIIATPILTGPGVITTAVLFSAQYGAAIVLIAGVIALLLTWIILRSATVIMKFVGEQVIGILSKIIGLLIAAMAVEYIFGGALAWFNNNSVELISLALSFI
ncbi:MAG: MarC family protein [Candidatus Methanogranum gryphiswaldense]|nr:MAG: MarC family protein [Candidatus Methanogranum sp. U3.2.1]